MDVVITIGLFGTFWMVLGLVNGIADWFFRGYGLLVAAICAMVIHLAMPELNAMIFVK